MTDETPQLQVSPQGCAMRKRVVAVEKKFEKIFENPLDKFP